MLSFFFFFYKLNANLAFPLQFLNKQENIFVFSSYQRHIIIHLIRYQKENSKLENPDQLSPYLLTEVMVQNLPCDLRGGTSSTGDVAFSPTKTAALAKALVSATLHCT